jgi:hypothetical protein
MAWDKISVFREVGLHIVAHLLWFKALEVEGRSGERFDYKITHNWSHAFIRVMEDDEGEGGI